VTITRATIRAAAKAALERHIPGVPVLVGRAWPLAAPELGARLLLSLGDQDMRAKGKASVPSYLCSMPVTVRMRLAVNPNPATPPGESAHGNALEAAADEWSGKLRDALLGDPDFAQHLGEGAARVEVQVPQDPGAGEQLIIEIAFTVSCEWIETYQPRLVDDLATIAVRLDAIEPADKLGTYPAAPPFPDAAAAPREAGPDGRAEAGLTITLPTN
jgi:hypothetical protein